MDGIVGTQTGVVIDNLVGRIAEQFRASNRKQRADHRQTNHQHQLPTKGAQILQQRTHRPAKILGPLCATTSDWPTHWAAAHS